MENKDNYDQWRPNQDSSGDSNSNESANCPVNPNQVNDPNSDQPVNPQVNRSRSNRNRRSNQGNQGNPIAEVPIYVKRVHIMGQPLNQSMESSTNLDFNINQSNNLNVNQNASQSSGNKQQSSTGMVVRNLKRRAKDKESGQSSSSSSSSSQPQQFHQQQLQSVNQPLQQQFSHLPPQPQPPSQFIPQCEPQPQFQQQELLKSLLENQFPQQFEPQMIEQQQVQPQLDPQFQGQFFQQQIEAQQLQQQFPPQEPQISPNRLAYLEEQYQRQRMTMEIQRQHCMAALEAQQEANNSRGHVEVRPEHETISTASSIIEQPPQALPPPPPYPTNRMNQQTYDEFSTQPKRRPLANQSFNQQQQSNCFRTPGAPPRPSPPVPPSIRSTYMPFVVPPVRRRRRRSGEFELPMTIQQPPRYWRPSFQQRPRFAPNQQENQQRPQQPQQQPQRQFHEHNLSPQEQQQIYIPREPPYVIRRNPQGQSGQGNMGQSQNNNNQRVLTDELNKLIDDPGQRQMVSQLYRRYSAPIERQTTDEPLDLSRSGQPIELSTSPLVMPRDESPSDGQGGGGGIDPVNLSTSSQDSHIVDLSNSSQSSDKSIRVNGQSNGNSSIGQSNANLSIGQPNANLSIGQPINTSNNQMFDVARANNADEILSDESSSSSMSIPDSASSSPSKLVN